MERTIPVMISESIKSEVKVTPKHHNESNLKAYKIVEADSKGIRTLFHGLNGSRTMPTEEWLRADMKLVKDGTSKTEYTSGWHVLLDKEEAENFIKKMFRTRLELLKVVKVEVKGDIWSKKHSRSPVYLAEWIKF